MRQSPHNGVEDRQRSMKKREKRNGLTLVHTGDGKGKSSSAFGMVFRAAGWGMKVLVVQFIKGKWKTGEQQAASRFDNIEWHALGDGFTWDTNNPEQDQQTTRSIWSFCQQKILSEAYDLVVLDEINYCCSYGWLKGKEVADFIKQSKPDWMHLVLTGRQAPDELIEIADTVTEMRLVKHAFEQGITAEQGIEF
ncbi:MAG: cob(I)yrinic acid a,c-diamide adenosyltransferase [Candidatus Thiodiazotropha taylori]|nr:cob(I)yrinic acid a,c-diamide adenosyltransferase [Candidatus Thiodiazotropha taylori]MCW4241031.1 cob(I)yrinic acid a,c-diamide adenosyltransferase [Candidatus Thiodiazotropha taylori]MCW4312447.1 cob(I)yrinic acid a,c-diamide adenosyltransferase [Candidatus Thiodiazotropha taylori]MCW4317561.1 cob(I)yrinic acid a,c-diamide adenosyltransferase [Candidatus Thiodiazotropha taylori]MCW4323216.1 cob(I)yrinic acid a,c-diamide adenosyltransferase [Candidatus Thiodiazotropha taylori]